MNTYTLTDDALKAADFRPYRPSAHERYELAFCYTSRDRKGKRFHVHVRKWGAVGGLPQSYDAWMQCNRHSDDTFQIEKLSVREMTPAEIVAWFENAWMKMECEYYERNGE